MEWWTSALPLLSVVVSGVLLKRAQSVDVSVSVKDLFDRVKELEDQATKYEKVIQEYQLREYEHERMSAKRDAEMAELKSRVRMLEELLATHGIDPI